MSKLARRIVSVFIATLFLLPQVAVAATGPEVIDEIEPAEGTALVLEIPLGPTQTEYTMSVQSASTNPAKIISVSSTPTKVSGKVHPDLTVTIAGTAVVTTCVYLQKLVNGSWQPDSSIYHSKSVTNMYNNTNSHEAVANNTYRFVIDVFTAASGGSDSYTFTGNPFVFK